MPRLPDVQEGDVWLSEDVSSCENRQPYGLRIPRSASLRNYRPSVIFIIDDADADRLVLVLAASYQSYACDTHLVVNTGWCR